jgi:hypothetical protein
MSNLLVFYEIKDKASKVRTKKALREFEQWVNQTLKNYHDAAVEQVARIHLIQLKEQYHLA